MALSEDDNGNTFDPNKEERDRRRQRRRQRRRDEEDEGERKKNQKSSIARVLNPPFDPRILQIGPPGHRALERGFMVIADPKFAPGGTGVRHRINFLFNPQTVDVGHQLNPNVVTDPHRPPQDPTSLGPMRNFGETSLSLLFDRTYELWDRSQRRTRAGRYGVYADVLAFYIYLGITTTEVEDRVGGGQAGGVTYPGSIPEGLTGGGSRMQTRQVWTSLYPDSWMLYVPSYFYVGNKLKYYGKVNHMAVQYTHWTLNMVPSRCVVSLSISLDADPNRGKKLSLGAARDPVGDGSRANKPGSDSGIGPDRPDKHDKDHPFQGEPFPL